MILKQGFSPVCVCVCVCVSVCSGGDGVERLAISTEISKASGYYSCQHIVYMQNIAILNSKINVAYYQTHHAEQACKM